MQVQHKALDSRQHTITGAQIVDFFFQFHLIVAASIPLKTGRNTSQIAPQCKKIVMLKLQVKDPCDFRKTETQSALLQCTLGKKKNTVMIQPQVHLRLPCYDFYFL